MLGYFRALQRIRCCEMHICICRFYVAVLVCWCSLLVEAVCGLCKHHHVNSELEQVEPRNIDTQSATVYNLSTQVEIIKHLQQ